MAHWDALTVIREPPLFLEGGQRFRLDMKEIGHSLRRVGMKEIKQPLMKVIEISWGDLVIMMRISKSS